MKLHLPVTLFRLVVLLAAAAPVSLYAAAGMQAPESITIPSGYSTIVTVDELSDFTDYSSTEGNVAFKIAEGENGVVFDGVNTSVQAAPKGSWYITSSSADNLSTLSFTNSLGRQFYTTSGQQFLMENLGAFNYSGGSSTGYGDNRGGTFMIVYGTAAFHNNGTLSFADNSRYYEKRGNGGVFYIGDGDTLSFTQNDNVSFSGNTASADTLIGAGGAIYAMRGAQLNFADNKSLSFEGNKAFAVSSKTNVSIATYHFSGGALYLIGTEDASAGSTDTSTLTISGNTSVDFRGNEARCDVTNQQAFACYGGAIRSGDDTVVSITENGKLTFDSNLAWSQSRPGQYTYGSSNVYGGAVHVGANAQLSISDNGEVIFNKNQACSTSESSTGYARGGAVHGGVGATLTFSGNTSLTFSGNTATSLGGTNSSYANVYGGAIFVGDGGSIGLLDNETLVLSGNKAISNVSSSTAYGGALSGQYVSICGNGKVTISGNVAQAGKGTARAGAIYGISSPSSGVPQGGSVTIAGNGNVLIENNAEIDKDGTRLRAIYTTGELSLSASTNKEVRVRDAVYAIGNVTLNADYSPSDGGAARTSDGLVVLDGSTSAANLSTLLGREANFEELRASRTSYFGDTTLENGTFALQGEACLMADSFSLDSSNAAELSLDSGKMRTEAFSTRENTSTLSLSGSSYALFTQGTLGDNTTLAFNSAGVGQNARLAGDISTGELIVNVDASTLEKGNSYCLFTLAAGSAMEWDASKVTLTGTAAEDGKLVWNHGSLFLDYGVNGSGTQESIMTDAGGRILSEEHVDVTQATADLLYSSEGSQKFTLKEDIVLDNKSLTFNGLVGYYEVTSADAAAPVSLTVQNLENGMLGGTEATYRLNIHDLSALTFKKAVADEYAGAIYLSDGCTGEIRNVGTVSFSGNLEGDLVKSMVRVTSGSSLLMENNGKVAFKDNHCLDGGAISVLAGSRLEMTGNGEIEFSGNGRTTINDNIYVVEHGGAIYAGGADTEVSLHDNGKLTFSGNSAEHGGAVYVTNGAKASFADNDQILFTDNGKANEKPAYGGGIYVDGASTLEMTGNKSLTFRENAVGSGGAAIYAAGAYEKGGVTVLLSGNDSILMEKNTGYSASAFGLSSGGTFSVVGNGDVTIQNNHTHARAGNLRGSAISISHEGSKSYDPNNMVLSNNRSLSILGNYGCGIEMTNYGGSLKIQNNDSFLLSGNYYVADDGSYITRGMKLSGLKASTTNTEVVISAAAGHVAEIRDYITVDGTINFSLNADYIDAENKTHKQTGDVLFTGAFTADNIKAAKGGREATETELAASLTSTVNVATTLYGGRLRVEDGAVFKGVGLTVAEGSGATVLVKDAVLDHTGYDLTFNSGTTLEVKGESSVLGNLVMKSGAALVVDAATMGLSGITKLGDDVTVSSLDGAASMAKLSLASDGVTGKAKDSGLTSVSLTTGNKTYFLSDVSLNNVELTTSNATAYSLTNVDVDAASSFNLNGGSAVMHGDGSYDLGAATALASGVTLADDWTGTVKLTGSNIAGLNIDLLSKGANSSVELSGVTGYLTQANGNNAKTYATNLILSNKGESAAWSLTNGWSGDTRTFSGSVSGSGDIVRTSWRGTVQNIEFSGNTAGWTGEFKHDVDSGAQNGVVVKTNLTFSGSSEINAEISTNGKGELNVTLDDANIKSRSNSVTVNKDMKVTSLTVTEGTAAVFMKTLTSQGESYLKAGASLSMVNASTLKGINGAEAIFSNIVLSASSAEGGSLTNLTISSDSETYGIESALLDNVHFTSSLDSTLTLTNVNIGENCSFDVGTDGLIALSGATLTLTLPSADAAEDGLLSIDCSDLFHCSAEGDMALTLGDMTAEELLAAGYTDIEVDFGSDVNCDELKLTIAGATYKGSSEGKARFTLVPEPTTATLSLMALAALAARRRRKGL